MASVIEVRHFRPWQPLRVPRQASPVRVRHDEARLIEWRMRLWRDAMRENGNRITVKREREMLAEITAEVAAFIAAEKAKSEELPW